MTGIGHGYVTQEHISVRTVTVTAVNNKRSCSSRLLCDNDEKWSPWHIFQKSPRDFIASKNNMQKSCWHQIVCECHLLTDPYDNGVPTKAGSKYALSSNTNKAKIKKSRIYPFKDRPASRFGIAAVKWSVGGSVGSGGWCRFPLLECFPRRRWATWRAPPSPTRTVQRAVNFSSAASLFSPRISSA